MSIKNRCKKDEIAINEAVKPIAPITEQGFEPIQLKAAFHGPIPQPYGPYATSITISGKILAASGLSPTSKVMISCDKTGEITIRKQEPMGAIEEEQYARSHA
jgi:hypothetical protein